MESEKKDTAIPADPAQPTPANEGQAPREPRTLMGAIQRAAGRAARTPVWVIPFWRGGDPGNIGQRFKRDVSSPLGEMWSVSAAWLRSVRGAAQKDRVVEAETQAPTRLFTEHSEEEILQWKRVALLTWSLSAGMCLLAAAYMAYALNGGHGFMGLNMITMSICMQIVGVFNGLRAARDMVLFRTRQPLATREFFRRVGELWCPLDANEPIGKAVRYALPAVWVGLLFGAGLVSAVPA